MAVNNEDEFWNASSSSCFNFDDDEETLLSFSDLSIDLTREDSVPIHSLISKHDLDLVLDDIQSVQENIVAPVEEIIRKMFNGQTYYLEAYRTLSDKILLLDAALKLKDGNIVINVIFFLKRTLKQNIFFHQLSKRAPAVKYYANYLIANGNIQELADVYMATGNNAKMKHLYHFIGRDITAKDVLYKRLEQFVTEHIQRFNNDEEKMELYEHMKLLTWQIERKETANTVIGQLAETCKIQLEKDKYNYHKIMALKMLLKIDDAAYDWTVMNVMASMQLWSEIRGFFIKPNWLTKKNMLKTAVPLEKFVYGLSRHKPPNDILDPFLACIYDTETCLRLAEKLNYHKFVIQHYLNQRDRQALMAYKDKLKPESEEYCLIENAFQSDQKWKN